ncbi:hypothetical protein LH407_04705 [Antiquaquibacter oligotrophicus]|nr:hypothetical protein [Antiquaquibacter oligotrophicus]UDF14164.1 hypothetical protein LH407_04705 [Antiquaquibacter oligotrophicus]
MDVAAGKANSKVLLHPLKPGEVVRSSNEVGVDVLAFHQTLGIEANREVLEKKRWSVAAGEARDAVRETGTSGFNSTVRLGAAGAAAVREFGAATTDNAKTTAGKLADGLAKKVRRTDSGEEQSSDAEK